LIFVGR